MQQPHSTELEESYSTETSRVPIAYLHKVPIEVWSEILTLVFSPYFYDIPIRTKPFYLEVDPSHQKIREIQLERAPYVRICKTLRPLAEQLLYTEVILNSPSRFKKFMMRAAEPSSKGRHCGEWTKSLRVHSHYRQAVSVDFEEIFSILPNLISLEIGEMVHVDLEEDVWAEEWSSGLRHLYWKQYNLKWEDLREMSIRFPLLSDLTMIGCEEDNRKQEPITFLNLRHFTTSIHCSEHFDISQLNLPLLESLKVEIDGADAFDSLIERYGAQLKRLEFTPMEDLGGETLFPLRGRKLFDLCTALERITFIADMFEPINVSGAEVFSPHKHLSHLVMAIEQADDESFVTGHAKYFSQERFPAIKYVTVFPRWGQKKEDVLDSVQKMFPRAAIQVEDED